jgi:TnsA endonuclease N terminal/TnsA endonuclease C terminal
MKKRIERGRGRGAEYRPYLETHEVPSRGLATRTKSTQNGRVQHTLSQLETDWLHAFRAIPGLVDIREQFPLNLEETVQIADRLEISHTTDPRTKERTVVTTDFLLNFSKGCRETEIAVAIKPAADLGSARTLEKLEIERVYWAARKIPWRIITERELPRALVKNMKWIHTHLDLVKSGEFSNDQIHRIRITMESDVMQGQRSLVQIAAACDDRLGLKPGAALCVTRHLIGTGIWPVDLTVEIDPQQPLCIIRKPINHEIAA